jgi:hypothetical protein
MTLEHYPGMTEKQLLAVVQEAERQWSILDVASVACSQTSATLSACSNTSISSDRPNNSFKLAK